MTSGLDSKISSSKEIKKLSSPREGTESKPAANSAAKPGRLHVMEEEEEMEVAS
jgi:hypothetical protein